MIIKNELTGLGYKVEELCFVHKISRQAFYQWKKREIKQYYEEEIILQLVCEKRSRQPKVGGRKLYYMLKKKFRSLDFKIGRDRLFNILQNNGLLVKNKKNYVRTTNSNHRFYIYTNLIKDLVIDRPNQVVVADITYIDTAEGFMYLALLTDVYSRKIIGHDVSESLSIDGSLRALLSALKGIKLTEGIFHHSDRGIQYCSNEYTELLKAKGIKISMAEKGNPYENAIAERVNGILKIEFLLNHRFSSKKEVKRHVSQSIKIYNEERPHMSLGYMTPAMKYRIKSAA